MKRFLLTLLLALSLGIGAAWAESYTVTFATATSDPNNFTENTYIKEGASYVNGQKNNKCYAPSRNGIKLGSGSATGYIELTLADDCQVVPSKVSFRATKYGSDPGSLKVTVCGKTETFALTSAASEKEFTFTLPENPSKISTIRFETTSKRASVGGFTVEYNNGPVAVENLTLSPLEFDVNDEKTLTVTPEDFVSGVTGLSFTSKEDVAYFSQGENNKIEAMAFSAGETDLTLSWGDGSKYLAGTKTFKVKVNALKPTLSYSAETCEVILDEEPYELPVLTADNKGLKVVYSSSNEDVALFVDGKLVIGDPGTTTITARIEAVAGQNEGAEASYELTVKPAGVLASPVFTPVGGTYELSEIVTISATSGATIYYGVGTTKEEAITEYTEEFMLEKLGEVTYVAYATKDGRESEIVTVTYNVVKADAVFGFDQSEYTVKMGTMPSELPVPSTTLNYTLSSSNTSVASLDPVIGAELWLLSTGDTEITATYAGDDTTNPATAKYTLHVVEAGTPAQDASVTFNFLDLANEKYGLENAETESRNDQIYFKSGATAKQGDVTIVLNKKNNSNGWRIYENKDLRIYTSSDASMEISVGKGVITKIDFDRANSGTIKSYTVNGGSSITPDPTTKFTVDCTGLNSGTIIFTPTVGKNGVIGDVTVYYTIPAVPDTHASANLAMEGDREVVVDDETSIEGASVANDVDRSVVNYLVLNADGTSLDDDFVITPNVSDNGISVVTTAEIGEYRLLAYIEPSDKYYPAIVEAPLYVRTMITPAELYIHGHFYNRYYDLTAPVKMEKNGKVFTANDVLIGCNPDHTDDEFDFVFTTHKLDRAEAPEQSMMRAAAAAGSHQWDALTEGYVYHAPQGNALSVTPASEVTEASHITPINGGKEGFYQFEVDFSNGAEAPTYVAEYTGSVTTGVEGVTVESADKAVYYDLTGRRVANPSAGVFIRVQGGKAEKIMIK